MTSPPVTLAPGQPIATETAPPSAMLDVIAVAEMLSVSTRHVRRLADSGAMPRPVKLGALVRWRRDLVERWIADGCPHCD